MAWIDVRHLTVRYPRAPRPALQDVSLQVERGETLLLLGPSGSGKSTLGLCLAGLIPDSVPAAMQGEIWVGGQNMADLSVGRRTAQVGIVFQDPEAQFCMLTVEDEIAFGLENMALPREEIEGRIIESLRMVGLEERRRERVDRLSGGQKQRLALACALARRPSILFLDEPTANLDPAARFEFFQWLGRLRADQPDITIIIVEHILDDLIPMVDRVMLLSHEGRLMLAGAPAEVFQTNGEMLDEMGIWLPQVTALARRLRSAGIPLARLPLTVDEAKEIFTGIAPAGPLPAEPPRRTMGGMAGEPPALEARRLSFRYRAGAPEVLRDLSLVMPEGAFMALVGPNGAGKTTLALHFVGILPPPAGRVFLLGRDIAALTTADITAQVGFVFQNPEHQFVERTVEAELAYSLRVRRRPESEIAQVTNALLASFGLMPYRQLNPFALSQGQKRRLSVATMLAVGQRVLILDEPTFGQDRNTAHALMERLQTLHAAGITILAITHDMQLVADYAHIAAVVVDGQVRFCGTPHALFANEELTAAADLRPPPLYHLAKHFGLRYGDGTRPLSIREWMALLQKAPTAGGAGKRG